MSRCLAIICTYRSKYVDQLRLVNFSGMEENDAKAWNDLRNGKYKPTYLRPISISRA
jgi:hypothetical protein